MESLKFIERKIIVERKSFKTAEKAIESSGEEWLEIGQYAHGMAEYIRQCATPSIISIQGEWGAGKTSLILNYS